jgi:hypothetical protein
MSLVAHHMIDSPSFQRKTVGRLERVDRGDMPPEASDLYGSISMVGVARVSGDVTTQTMTERISRPA